MISTLEAIASGGRPFAVSDVQQATGLPTPTCYRLVHTLLSHGLLDRSEGSGRYVIGERLVRIALLGKSDVDVCDAVSPRLKSTAVQVNESVFLARLQAGQVKIIHVETPDDPERSYIHPGLSERPFHACSCAKAIAAFAEPNFRNEILFGPLAQYTEFTKTSRDELIEEFESIVERGYADCDQEVDPGIASVAAPVSIGEIGAAYSIGAVGPVLRFGEDKRADVGRELVSLAGTIGAAIQLGGSAQT
ncbi:MAG: IclR family transcriptional regulator [Pseudomonadota bacterium]